MASLKIVNRINNLGEWSGYAESNCDPSVGNAM